MLLMVHPQRRESRLPEVVLSQAPIPSQTVPSVRVGTVGRDLVATIGGWLRRLIPWVLALYLGRVLWFLTLFPTLMQMLMGLGTSLWQEFPADQPGVAAIQRIGAEWWFPSQLEVSLQRVGTQYGVLGALVLLGGAVAVARRRLQRDTGTRPRLWSWATLGLVVLVGASTLLTVGLCTRPFSQEGIFLHDMGMQGHLKETLGWIVFGFPVVALVCRWLIHRKSVLAGPRGFRARAARAASLVAYAALLALLFQVLAPTYTLLFSRWLNPSGALILDEAQSPSYYRIFHHLLVVLSGLAFLFVRHLFRHLAYGAPLWPTRALRVAGAGMVLVSGFYWGDGYLFRDFGRPGLVRRAGLAEPALHPRQVEVEARSGTVRATLKDGCLILGGARWVRHGGWFTGDYLDEHLAPTPKAFSALEGVLSSPDWWGSTYRGDPLVPLINSYRQQGRLTDYVRLVFGHLYQANAPGWAGMARSARRYFALTPVDEEYRRAAAYAIDHADPMNRDKVLLATIAALRTGNEEVANRLLALVILNGWSLDTSGSTEGKGTLSGAGGIDKLSRNFTGLLRGTGQGAGADAEKGSSALVQDWLTSSTATFRQEGELKGVVLLEGRPPQEGWVDLVAEANEEGVNLGTRLFSRKLDASGAFHLEGLVPGTYSLNLRFLGQEGLLKPQATPVLSPSGKALKARVEGPLTGLRLGRGHQRVDLGVIRVWLEEATEGTAPASE